MLRARANGETFVSATMCPQLCILVCQYLYSANNIHEKIILFWLAESSAEGVTLAQIEIVILDYDWLNKDDRKFSKQMISRISINLP